MTYPPLSLTFSMRSTHFYRTQLWESGAAAGQSVLFFWKDKEFFFNYSDVYTEMFVSFAGFNFCRTLSCKLDSAQIRLHYETKKFRFWTSWNFAKKVSCKLDSIDSNKTHQRSDMFFFLERMTSINHEKQQKQQLKHENKYSNTKDNTKK